MTQVSVSTAGLEVVMEVSFHPLLEDLSSQANAVAARAAKAKKVFILNER